MQKIKIDEVYLDDVFEGIKVSTIRAGYRAYSLGKTELVSPSRNVEVTITKVSYILYKNLTLDDAVSDGFSSLEELKCALKIYYPNLSDNDEVTIVYYKVDV